MFGLVLGAYGGYELGTAIASQTSDAVQMAGLAGAALCAYVGYKVGRPLGVRGAAAFLGTIARVCDALDIPTPAFESYRKERLKEVPADATSALEAKLAEGSAESVSRPDSRRPSSP